MIIGISLDFKDFRYYFFDMTTQAINFSNEIVIVDFSLLEFFLLNHVYSYNIYIYF